MFALASLINPFGNVAPFFAISATYASLASALASSSGVFSDGFGGGGISFGFCSGTDSDGASQFASIAEAGGIDPSGPYTGESYDAAALIVLAMQAGGSADRQSIADNIMGVANAPGDEILPGELAKALKILAGGGQINYQGATDVELTDVGEASGSFKEVEVGGGKFNTVQIR